jgi:hypothetical protein
MSDEFSERNLRLMEAEDDILGRLLDDDSSDHGHEEDYSQRRLVYDKVGDDEEFYEEDEEDSNDNGRLKHSSQQYLNGVPIPRPLTFEEFNALHGQQDHSLATTSVDDDTSEEYYQRQWQRYEYGDNSEDIDDMADYDLLGCGDWEPEGSTESCTV